MDDHISSDYETDFLIWIARQVELLHAKHFDQLDAAHLIEELKSMALKKKHQLRHRLEKLIMHLLKCQLQREHISGSWLGTIREQRHRIQDLLQEMPSLAPLIDIYLPAAYAHAAARAADETRLPRAAFPATLPYTKDQLLDADYLP